MAERVTADNPTDWQAWKWKAATFRRCLNLCDTEAEAEKFIAQEFASIYGCGLVHGKTGTGFVTRGNPEHDARQNGGKR